MLSLIEQLNFNKPELVAKFVSDYKRPNPPLYKKNGYSSSVDRRKSLTKEAYTTALSKRKWSSAKDLMLDLGLKSTVCVTKTMRRPYLDEITNKKISRNPGKGGNFYLWSLKEK